jgi:dTDP-4-amino-4,6-dideoxygalactose transaminase
VKRRQQIASYLTDGLKELDGLRLPIVQNDCSHVYYTYPLVLDKSIIKIDKQLIKKALQAEGLEGISDKYQNIHLLPIFQQKLAYGSKGFPWQPRSDNYSYNYKKGICPIAEDFQDNTYMGFAMCMHEMTDNEIELTINAFKKVWKNLDKLEYV